MNSKLAYGGRTTAVQLYNSTAVDFYVDYEYEVERFLIRRKISLDKLGSRPAKPSKPSRRCAPYPSRVLCGVQPAPNQRNGFMRASIL